VATTRLDWDILKANSPRLVPLDWVTGKVRDDFHPIFDYLCRRFNDEVEKIIKAHSWGWAGKPVFGFASVPSEHWAGAAIDLNAPAHPIKVPTAKTFSAAQIKAIQKIVADPILEGCIDWGGDGWARPDAMHFQVQGGIEKIRRVAKAIKALDAGVPAKPTTPTGKAPAKTPAATAAKGSTTLLYQGNPKNNSTRVKKLQAGLNKRFPAYSKFAGNGDGKFGPYTAQVVREFQRRSGLKPDGVVGPTTIKALRKHGINL
jgi:hypothetical protein